MIEWVGMAIGFMAIGFAISDWRLRRMRRALRGVCLVTMTISHDEPSNGHETILSYLQRLLGAPDTLRDSDGTRTIVWRREKSWAGEIVVINTKPEDVEFTASFRGTKIQ